MRPRIEYLTPAEAEQLTGVPAHRIEFDVKRHAIGDVSYLISVEQVELSGVVAITGYFAADLVRAYDVRNAALKLASIELGRLIESSKRKPRARAATN